jgi:thiosulfate dehydrogenase [quinone] large subunit
MSIPDFRVRRRRDIVALFARLALAASFLTAVADRLGQYGPPGTPTVAWGDMQHLQAYAAQLNPWFPAGVIPLLSWVVTVAETVLGLSLIAGFQVRRVAVASGALLLAFAIGMTAGTGIRSALYASVFSASACAFLLSQREPDAFTLDHLIFRCRRRRTERAGDLRRARSNPEVESADPARNPSEHGMRRRLPALFARRAGAGRRRSV